MNGPEKWSARGRTTSAAGGEADGKVDIFPQGMQISATVRFCIVPEGRNSFNKSMYSLHQDGFFRQADASFFPVGVNYWPGSCGVEMWVEWPEDEIQADLDAMVAAKLNTIRFFLRWPDFQPRLGEFKEENWAKLTTFLGWCRERNIATIPTLFVGFMSGGFFYPEGKDGVNIFADPVWREGCRAYAAEAARRMAPWQDCILAVDHGNENASIRDSWTAGADALRGWSATVSQAVKDEMPGVLVMSGLDHNQVCVESGWHFGVLEGCDCLSIHGYPVGGWWPIPFDGMGDPLCRELLPLAVSIARAHGPVMLQEFGTIVTGGPEQMKAYVEALLPRVRAAGVNGWLWWCLRDIPTLIHPYNKHSIEGSLGLLDGSGQVKEGLSALHGDFSAVAGVSASDPKVALLWPEYVQAHDRNPGNTPEEHFTSLAPMATGLTLAGETYRVVRSTGELPSPEEILVVAGSSLTGTEIGRLRDWVKAGGRLIWQGLDFHNAGRDAEELLGAVVADVRSAVPDTFSWGGKDWSVGTYRRRTAPELRLIEATALAHDSRGLVQVFRRNLGHGVVLGVVADSGQHFSREEPRRENRAHWGEWVGLLLATVRQ